MRFRIRTPNSEICVLNNLIIQNMMIVSDSMDFAEFGDTITILINSYVVTPIANIPGVGNIAFVGAPVAEDAIGGEVARGCVHVVGQIVQVVAHLHQMRYIYDLVVAD